MARYTFVTESHALGDEKQTVDIPSKSDISKIVESHVSDVSSELAGLGKKLAKYVDRLDKHDSSTDELRDEIDRLRGEVESMESRIVEHCREIFKDIIEEQIYPIYSQIGKVIGIEVKTVHTPKPSAVKKDSATVNLKKVASKSSSASKASSTKATTGTRNRASGKRIAITRSSDAHAETRRVLVSSPHRNRTKLSDSGAET